MDEREPGRHPRWRRRIVAASVGLVVLGLAVVTARLFVWPPLPSLPAHADAIVELGGPGDRDAIALTLARQHRARFLVQSTVSSDALSDACLPPVPGVTILCIHAQPATTRGEAQYVRRLAEQYHWTLVILVTTPDQAWRARLRVTRCFSGAVYVSTTPLPAHDWLWEIPYQWAATAKALTVQSTC